MPKPPWCTSLKDGNKSKSPSKTDTTRPGLTSKAQQSSQVHGSLTVRAQGLYRQLESTQSNPLSPRCKTVAASQVSKTINPGVSDSRSTKSSPSRTYSVYAKTSRSGSPESKLSSTKEILGTNLKIKETGILNTKLKLKVLTAISNSSISSGSESDASESKSTKKNQKEDSSNNMNDANEQSNAADNQIPTEVEPLEESQIAQLAKDLQLPSFQAIVGRLYESAKQTVVETPENKPLITAAAVEITLTPPENNDDRQSCSTSDVECGVLNPVQYCGVEPFERMLENIIDCFERSGSTENESTLPNVSVEAAEVPNANLMQMTALKSEEERKIEDILEPKPVVDEKESVTSDQITKDEANKPEEKPERELRYGEVNIVIGRTQKEPPVDPKSSKVSKSSKDSKDSKATKNSESSKSSKASQNSESSKSSKASKSSKKSESSKASTSTGESNNAKPESQKKKRSIKNFFKKIFSFGRKKKDT